MGCKLFTELLRWNIITYTVEIRAGATSLLLLIDRFDNQRFSIEGLIFVIDENPRDGRAVFLSVGYAFVACEA